MVRKKSPQLLVVVTRRHCRQRIHESTIHLAQDKGLIDCPLAFSHLGSERLIPD
jgi:hypothetical protein